VNLDVTDAAGIASAMDQATTWLDGAPLDGLVNNAGIVVGGPLEYLPLDDFRRQFEVNVVGLLAVTQAALPLLRRGRGRIVNIGSIGGRVTSPIVGPYCASKFAVEALSDALRLELAEWGIYTSVIEPGVVSTPIWDKGVRDLETATSRLPAEAMQRYGRFLKAMRRIIAGAPRRGVPVDKVAGAAEHALTSSRPRHRYVIGFDARVRPAARHTFLGAGWTPSSSRCSGRPPERLGRGFLATVLSRPPGRERRRPRRGGDLAIRPATAWLEPGTVLLWRSRPPTPPVPRSPTRRDMGEYFAGSGLRDRRCGSTPTPPVPPSPAARPGPGFAEITAVPAHPRRSARGRWRSQADRRLLLGIWALPLVRPGRWGRMARCSAPQRQRGRWSPSRPRAFSPASGEAAPDVCHRATRLVLHTTAPPGHDSRRPRPSHCSRSGNPADQRSMPSDPVAFRYDGVTWSVMETRNEPELWSIWGDPATLYAAGQNGVILR
jgi:NAD(P)-dependent dehydrogenase (short-subunit alcohol dehydrogenase family)